MIEKPKKERRFLKTLGRVGEILVEQVLLKLGSSIIKKIGGKKTLPSILFLLASFSLFAQYPNTGNKQRLGFQTTGDGLTWRGSLSDTASIQPINNQNAWVILDTVNLKIYSFDFTSNTWNALSQDTTSLSNRINLKLNAADTASLSNRINLKGSGTVESVATGYGLSGGTITSTGTLLLDSAVVFSRIRDSIVDVAIGNDTIKILKQEYAPATTSVLTWTITPKFPIQLKAYILVFRNGQLLINDQYNLTDTNKITIVSSSFKVGANYTVVTVSGIGSVGTGTFPNPVYPEAGIAVSTGSAWASSVPNNSANWILNGFEFRSWCLDCCNRENLHT